MGVARSFHCEPVRAWCGLGCLRALLAQPLPRDQGPDRVTRFQEKATREDPELLLPLRNAAHLRAAARAADGRNIKHTPLSGRTGREPRYGVGIAELQEWTYLGEPLVPLKGYPGVVWERPNRKKRRQVIHGQTPGFPAPDDHDA